MGCITSAKVLGKETYVIAEAIQAQTGVVVEPVGCLNTSVCSVL